MGEDCQENFASGCLIRKHHKYTVFAHNFRSYDGYFIMDYVRRDGIKTIQAENGGKIMMLQCPDHKLKFLDSLNFITSPLKRFPKSFGVTELKEGYFPHSFNNVGNQNYIGKIPDIEFLYLDGMSSSEKKDFPKWYEERKKCLTL